MSDSTNDSAQRLGDFKQCEVQRNQVSPHVFVWGIMVLFVQLRSTLWNARTKKLA